MKFSGTDVIQILSAMALVAIGPLLVVANVCGQEYAASGITGEIEDGDDPVVTVGNAQLTLIDNVKIATRDAGLVKELHIREGDRVAPGQVLVRLDHAMYDAELNAAIAEKEIALKESENDVDLRYAQKSAAVNDRVLARSREAVSQYERSISRTEIERLELELERSVLSGDQARHQQLVDDLTLTLRDQQMKIAELRLQFREIQSPIDGTVAEVFAQKGEWIAAGQPVVRVIGLNRLRCEALIGQEHSFRLKTGQRAVFEVKLGGQTLAANGKIVFVSPEVNPLTEEFLTWVEIDNSDGKLKPGFKGSLKLYSE